MVRECPSRPALGFAVGQRRALFGFGKSDEAGAPAEAPQHGDRGKALVKASKIPENYIGETLLPHLEGAIVEQGHTMWPPELAKVTVAYSKMPVKNKTICQKLADSVAFRLDGFGPEELVAVLFPLFEMAPANEKLWRLLARRAVKVMDQLSTMNLIAVVRVFGKLGRNEEGVLDRALPRVAAEIGQFDSFELNALLVAIGDHAESGGTRKDVHLLSVLLPEVVRKYGETSLLHTVENLWCLCRLKVYHRELMELAIRDLSNPSRIARLPPKYIAKVCWVMARFKRLDAVLKAFTPLIEGSAGDFRPAEFARLAQALPPESSPLLARVAANLLGTVKDMGRTELTLFALGCVRRGFLPLERQPEPLAPGGDPEPSGSSGSAGCVAGGPGEAAGCVGESGGAVEGARGLEVAVDREAILGSLLGYIEAEQDRFTNEEVRRLLALFRFSKEYKYLLHRLPQDWLALMPPAPASPPR